MNVWPVNEVQMAEASSAADQAMASWDIPGYI